MNTLDAPPRTVVIGIGNVHRRDDGAGPAVVARLKAGTGLPPAVGLHVSDGEPARLMGLWQGAEAAVVVDATRSTGPARPGRTHRPGRIHRLEAAGIGELPAPEGGTHGLGLVEAVRLARVLGGLPPGLVVYGVEAADTGFGTGLTPLVATAVESLAQHLRQQLLDHGRGATAPETERAGKRLPTPLISRPCRLSSSGEPTQADQ